MIIDTHAHLFDESTYRDYQKRSGGRVDRICTIHTPNEIAPDGKVIRLSLEEVIACAATKPDLSVIASVEMRKPVPDQLRSIEEHIRSGVVVGVKLYPGYEHFAPSDACVDPIAQFCAKHRVPLLFHSGDVYDYAGGALLHYAHPIHVDAVATRNPTCTMVIAHFGFPYLMETANVVGKNANVFTEISATISGVTKPAEVRRLTTQYAADLRRVFTYFPGVREKVMFGTDYGGEHTPLMHVRPYLDLVDRVFVPRERKRVLSELARELFPIAFPKSHE